MGFNMILSGFLLGFLVSFCWAADGSSDQEIPFVVASHSNANDEIPFVVASQSNANDEVPFVVASQSNTDHEIPFVVASQGNSDEPKVSNLLPGAGEPAVPPVTGYQGQSNRGRSDIEIEDDQTSGGYFYPKPSKPLNLPPFTTLDASAPANLVANFAEETSEVERFPRSPRRRPYYSPRPPPFVPGFIPPNNIRPLPALYGGPLRY